MAPIVEVRNLAKRFGGFDAVKNCTLSVESGTITGLIGPNGAGKTTLFNMIAGVFPPTSGSVHFNGEDITGLPSHTLFHRGMMRTFQIAHEFTRLTVLENLMMVPAGQAGENFVSALVMKRRVQRQEVQIRQRAEDVLEVLRLKHVRNELAGNLSGGQKKLLELGRTMMSDPRVVLLDEIAAGVNPTLLNDLAEDVLRLNRDFGYTFFVIEHDMDLIARLCSTVIVMAEGSVMTQGTMADLREDEAVIAAYFGGGSKAP